MGLFSVTLSLRCSAVIRLNCIYLTACCYFLWSYLTRPGWLETAGGKSKHPAHARTRQLFRASRMWTSRSFSGVWTHHLGHPPFPCHSWEWSPSPNHRGSSRCMFSQCVLCFCWVKLGLGCVPDSWCLSRPAVLPPPIHAASSSVFDTISTLLPRGWLTYLIVWAPASPSWMCLNAGLHRGRPLRLSHLNACILDFGRKLRGRPNVGVTASGWRPHTREADFCEQRWMRDGVLRLSLEEQHPAAAPSWEEHGCCQQWRQRQMNSNIPAGRVSDIHPHAELHASSSAELKVETKLTSSSEFSQMVLGISTWCAQRCRTSFIWSKIDEALQFVIK